METVTVALIAVVVAVVVKWFWDRHHVLQTWTRLGVPGPKSSSILFGNFNDLTKGGKYPTVAKWTKKYGKVFGYYEAALPTLVVSDADMAREILIKQFDAFEERRIFVDQTKDPFADLVSLTGGKWKKVRGLSSPTFSAKRMKQMSPLIHKSVDKLMVRMNERAEKAEAFDIASDVKRLTLDVIASTVFSYDTDVFNQEDNVFLNKLIEVFKSLDEEQRSVWLTIKLALAMLFPDGLKFVRLFNQRAVTVPNQWFLDLAKRVIEDRINTREQRLDYIQLMLMYCRKHVTFGNTSGNTSGTDTEDDVSDNETRESARDLRHGAKSKELSIEEMQGQIFVFLAAGYETTATTLAYMSYYLAMNPEVQSKLQDEIDQHFPDLRTKPVNYETVQQLPYLDMVFCETSRLGSIAQVVTQRISNRQTEVCGVRIPNNTKVVINMIDLHNDPEHWGPEPVEDFVPERFTKERKGARHPMAYMPFGGGPRVCIGMRFAIMEAKMVMINTLRRFTIVKCEGTQGQLKVTADGIRGPAEGVTVKVIKRE